MDTNEAKYVFAYYGHLMTEQERRAYRHLAGTMKAIRRRDAAAQAEAKGTPVRWFRELLSDDPQILFLAREGFGPFVERTGQRILNEHRDQIVMNRCPRCWRVARTPQARQCRFCRYDWHDKAASQTLS
jgi:hypothetical protein